MRFQRLLLARLRLFTREEGGRLFPISSNYCPNWNIGNTFEGQPALDSARVFLEGREQLFPGEEGVVLLEPLLGERWRHVTPGVQIPMHEASRVCGSAVVLEVIDSD